MDEVIDAKVRGMIRAASFARTTGRENVAYDDIAMLAANHAGEIVRIRRRHKTLTVTVQEIELDTD